VIVSARDRSLVRGARSATRQCYVTPRKHFARTADAAGAFTRSRFRYRAQSSRAGRSARERAHLSFLLLYFRKANSRPTYGSTASEKSTASTPTTDSDWTHSFIGRTDVNYIPWCVHDRIGSGVAGRGSERYTRITCITGCLMFTGNDGLLDPSAAAALLRRLRGSSASSSDFGDC